MSGTHAGRMRLLADVRMASSTSFWFAAPTLLTLLFVVQVAAMRFHAFARTMRAPHVKCCNPFEMFGVLPPIFKYPKVDADGNNGIDEVCFGAIDNDHLQVTVIFKDEDRPSSWQDFVYDNIRLPLFGRRQDIESFTLIRGPSGHFERIKFSGTYSGEQTWRRFLPKHQSVILPVSAFEKQDSRVVVWVNVWNHLFSSKNNNPTMEMVCHESYRCSLGTRKEINDRYCGLISELTWLQKL